MKLRNAALYCVAIGGGILVAKLAWHWWAGPYTGAGSGGLSTDASMVYPTSTDELVEHADIIIVGTVVTETFRGYSDGYDETTGQLGLFGTTPPPVMIVGAGGVLEPPRLPFSDYGVRVDRVYDGEVSLGQTIVLRLLGNADPSGTGPCTDDTLVPLIQVGASYLYFLTLEPDDEAFGLYYMAPSQLDISGAEVMVSWCTPEVVGWTEHTATSAFLAELESIISGR